MSHNNNYSLNLSLGRGRLTRNLKLYNESCNHSLLRLFQPNIMTDGVVYYCTGQSMSLRDFYTMILLEDSSMSVYTIIVCVLPIGDEKLWWFNNLIFAHVVGVVVVINKGRHG